MSFSWLFLGTVAFVVWRRATRRRRRQRQHQPPPAHNQGVGWLLGIVAVAALLGGDLDAFSDDIPDNDSVPDSDFGGSTSSGASGWEPESGPEPGSDRAHRDHSRRDISGQLRVRDAGPAGRYARRRRRPCNDTDSTVRRPQRDTADGDQDSDAENPRPRPRSPTRRRRRNHRPS
ncbi:hypothetical protein SPI_03445 [Niveomyces insectorum RCEF 264]|uniref:Uncharacterized protein n=1 Tax=Niveomyces insectorum RCEF 264 TaxID=1081102 RepID=A0A162J3J3_9HYPO|nr:hypothetical protein SPI_03445 [Niveomyces insectorum RCEF 264]